MVFIFSRQIALKKYVVLTGKIARKSSLDNRYSVENNGCFLFKRVPHNANATFAFGQAFI